MRGNSPKKWAMSEKLFDQPSPDDGWKRRMCAGIIDRYAELKKLEKEDKQAYELEVKRIGIEDAMFDIMAQTRTAPEDQKLKLKEQMRQQVAAFIDNRQEERRHRLDRLETQAKALRTEIKKFDDEKETQVTAQTEERLRTVFPGRGGHHRGPNGPGERRGDRPDRNDKGDRAGESRDRTD